eukprot:475422_1
MDDTDNESEVDEYNSTEESDDSGFSDAFASLQLMEHITKLEQTIQQKGVTFAEDGFHKNLAVLNMLKSITNTPTLWKCNICELLNHPNKLRCIACFEFIDLIKQTFKTDSIIITLMYYLDGATLINFYLCDICDINYNEMHTFIQNKKTFENNSNEYSIQQTDINNIKCTIDTNNTFKQWKQNIFNRLQISVWGQSFQNGNSYHLNYIPFNVSKINDRWELCNPHPEPP